MAAGHELLLLGLLVDHALVEKRSVLSLIVVAASSLDVIESRFRGKPLHTRDGLKMTTRVAQNGSSLVIDGTVNLNKGTVLVPDPHESKVLSQGNLNNWWSDLLQRQLFDLFDVLVGRVEAEPLQEAELIGNLVDELETSNMVDLDCASIGSNEELIMGRGDLSEVDAFPAHSGNELTELVKDQNLAILSEDKQEAGQLGHVNSTDGLLDVDPLLE